MEQDESVRGALAWSRESWTKWTAAYQRAIDDRQLPQPEFAAKQIILFDSFIQLRPEQS
ncbi:MAG: hypothetical protein JWN13_6908 [Betaproteobacteria bacterium]|jgi:hypothetical protein|nr:hypothetical protein [Betaproteobacteria bacterium]